VAGLHGFVYELTRFLILEPPIKLHLHLNQYGFRRHLKQRLLHLASRYLKFCWCRRREDLVSSSAISSLRLICSMPVLTSSRSSFSSGVRRVQHLCLVSTAESHPEALGIQLASHAL